ncbi:MAG TPA: hypothetical protein VFV87_17245 [Pirellulaceae bacterium]|nr:hypothetical protein [Pirellulaceae bacterium]
MSRRIRRSRNSQNSRPLQVERLEERSLLAVAAFTINLREDLGGTPGEILAADEVTAGECFFVEITAQEFDPLAHGLNGVALNLAWDPAALELEGSFDPAEIITDNLPMFRHGTLNAAAGTIRDLSGAAAEIWGAGRPIGDGTAETFAMLHFRATGDTSAASIRMSEGVSRIVTTPAATFTSAQLSFEQQTIAVAPANPAAVASTAEPPAPEPEFVPPPSQPVVEPQPEPLPPPAVELPTQTPIIATPPASEFTLEVPAAAPIGPFVDSTLDPPSSDEPAGEPIAFAPPSPAPASFAPAANACPAESPPPAAARLAAATDVAVALMGPLTPEQFHGPLLRLEQVIALIAADIAERRRHTALNSPSPLGP